MVKKQIKVWVDDDEPPISEGPVYAPNPCPPYKPPSVVYKTSRWMKSAFSTLLLLSVAGGGTVYSVVESHVQIRGSTLTVNYELSPTERRYLCMGAEIIFLDLEGC